MSTVVFRATRALVRGLIAETLAHRRLADCTVQGFGMLRTYLDADKVWRLNVWHASIAVPNVSTIHDHPWDFQSLVVAGTFRNLRYYPARHPEDGVPHSHMRIKTGEGGGPAGDPMTTRLVAGPTEIYRAGTVYRQRAEEIHESGYADGTVTLNERRRRPDGEHANVFWREGHWVDAEPRQATWDEVRVVLGDALDVIDQEIAQCR